MRPQKGTQKNHTLIFKNVFVDIVQKLGKKIQHEACENHWYTVLYVTKRKCWICETTDLKATANESSPVFYGCLLLLVTPRFNAMINTIQQWTFSRFCCEVWSSQIVSQSWNIKFPSSTHHVLIAEAGEGMNARGKIQAICYFLNDNLLTFHMHCHILHTKPETDVFPFAATDADATEDALATLHDVETTISVSFFYELNWNELKVSI